VENNQIKLNPTSDNIVELCFDSPKTGTNNYGAWYMYGVLMNGEEKTFFATENLHKKLSDYGKGANLNIKKEEYAPNKFAWEVHALNGTMMTGSGQKPVASTPISDPRTLDIHKQVCLKLAVQSMAHVKFDIKAVEERMYLLLDVLHGNKSDAVIEKVKEVFEGKELPF
jgi:hypothetical protein